jgi:hypothetical protein
MAEYKETRAVELNRLARTYLVAEGSSENYLILTKYSSARVTTRIFSVGTDLMPIHGEYYFVIKRNFI